MNPKLLHSDGIAEREGKIPEGNMKDFGECCNEDWTDDVGLLTSI